MVLSLVILGPYRGLSNVGSRRGSFTDKGSREFCRGETVDELPKGGLPKYAVSRSVLAGLVLLIERHFNSCDTQSTKSNITQRPL